jgi:alkylation response protein AidB-like acyl-CoA dehydrogenase
LTMLSGEHIQNEIFFTDVQVPKENVLGQVGMGWHVAKSLLEFERGGSVGSPILQHMHAQLAANARRTPTGEGTALIDDEGFAHKLADAKIRIEAFEALELRLLASARKNAGGAPSMTKVIFTELSQNLTELTLEAAAIAANRFQPHAAMPGGPIPGHNPPSDRFVAGEPWQSIAPLKYLNDRAATIYAGSNEIQRNIMTKMFLGL